MIVIGLTGSIGMGKSTTAALFQELGAAVHDADAQVAQLYAPGGAAVEPVLAAFPEACGDDGGVDRGRLSARIAGRPDDLRRLEVLVHPLVAARRAAFLAEQKAAGNKVVVLEVQLLFEVGIDKQVDKTVVVTAPAEVQRQRVLSRRGMTPEKFEQILRRQMSDAKKCARADYVIDASKGVEDARRQVAAIMAELARAGEAQH